MLNRPFLTELDSRAAVKGSVDPLGIQAIWVHFGREVVGNLTTVSTSVRDFSILLAGYYLAQRAVEDAGAESEVEAFLKWEQLASYVRAFALEEGGFRGVTRVRKRLAEGSRVVLSADQAEQTLSNQRLYGIFGLYSQPGRSSGWVQQDRVALTPVAEDLVEKYMIPVLAKGAGRDARELIKWLAQPSKRFDLERQSGMTSAVAALLAIDEHPVVRPAYRDHLLFGGPEDATAGRQRLFAQLLEPVYGVSDFVLDRESLGSLVRRAKGRSYSGSDLNDRLRDVWVCESLMAPAVAAFAYLLTVDGGTVEEAAQDLKATWGKRVESVDVEGIRAIAPMMPRGYGEEVVPSFVRTAEALGAGDYVSALRELIAQNSRVMQARGGSHWVEERAGKVRVSLRYDGGKLPSRESLAGLWRHAYFLDSVRLIGRVVGVA